MLQRLSLVDWFMQADNLYCVVAHAGRHGSAPDRLGYVVQSWSAGGSGHGSDLSPGHPKGISAICSLL